MKPCRPFVVLHSKGSDISYLRAVPSNDSHGQTNNAVLTNFGSEELGFGSEISIIKSQKIANVRKKHKTSAESERFFFLTFERKIGCHNLMENGKFGNFGSRRILIIGGSFLGDTGKWTFHTKNGIFIIG